MLVGLLNEATVAGPRFTAAAVQEIRVQEQKEKAKMDFYLCNKAFL